MKDVGCKNEAVCLAQTRRYLHHFFTVISIYSLKEVDFSATPENWIVITRCVIKAVAYITKKYWSQDQEMYFYKSEDEMAWYPRPKFLLHFGVYCHYKYTSRLHGSAPNAVSEFNI